MHGGFSFARSRLVVPVTREHIHMGHARSCTKCAVILALRDALEAGGWPHWGLRLTPYACWVEADGLILSTSEPWGSEFARMRPSDLPDGLIDWTMEFDAWAEQEEEGESDGEYQEPAPTTFVFDMGCFQPIPEPA